MDATLSPFFVSEETVLRRPGRAIMLAPGHTIGQCELIRLLGRGGMGEVHLARDLRLGRSRLLSRHMYGGNR
jgi:hypothetical protein